MTPTENSPLCPNLYLTCKRDIFRKRFVVRWGLLIFLTVLVINMFGKTKIKFDIRFGDRHEKRAVDTGVGWEDVVFNPKRNQRNEELREEKQREEKQREEKQKDEDQWRNSVVKDENEQVASQERFIPAFTGKSNLPPVFLDYIDITEPWDKQMEVSQ